MNTRVWCSHTDRPSTDAALHSLSTQLNQHVCNNAHHQETAGYDTATLSTSVPSKSPLISQYVVDMVLLKIPLMCVRKYFPKGHSKGFLCLLVS